MTADTPGVAASFRGRLGSFTLDIAFEAPMRGVTALFGPSGCGKTTILRCVAGLLKFPGELTVAGETWQDDKTGTFRKPHRRPLGYVFQEPSLFQHLSVRGNLLYGARRAGTDSSGLVLSFDDVVDLLGIGHLLARGPAALSGGERQRVAIGRALLSRPRLLLLDEPLSALDRATKDEILPYLEALRDRVPVPILHVSHDVSEVARLADRMVVMSEGRRIGEGTVTEILERLDLGPVTGRFEAGVVVTARVTGHDDDFSLTLLDLHGQAIVLPRADIAVGSQVRLRVRARDVALATQRPQAISVRNILAGRIAEIVEEPATAFAETLIDIGGARLRARLTRASVADLKLQPGQPVFALVKSISFDRRSLGAASELEESV